MPSFGTTPEALLGRNDSKNPSTTCKGLTSSGRPCRRALAAASSGTTPLPLRHKRKDSALGGVVAIVQDDDGEVEEARFYCWQHKGQARAEEKAGGGRRGREVVELRERSSIDTMVQKLGLDAGGKKEKKTRNPRPPRKTEAVDYATRSERMEGRTEFEQKPVRRKEKKIGFWSSLCCMGGDGGDEEDYVEVVRHKKRVGGSRPSYTTSTPTTSTPTPSTPTPSTQRPASASGPPRKPTQSPTARPPTTTRRSSNAQTDELLSLIPQNLSPQTTSALLAELIKPISPHDEEGYIYIFWLTPQSQHTPASETARSLLSPPQHQRSRRVSDVMTEFSFDGSEPDTSGKKTIMMKIGRANNVTRRMNEWQRQCGYALNLVRWYPYISSSSPHASPGASPSPRPSSQQAQPLYPDLARPPPPPASRRQSDVGTVRKVPCVKRVERLIHLELQEQQVKRQCQVCHREHKEWFEVEANQAGVRGVDGCVRRWVEWGERQAVL